MFRSSVDSTRRKWKNAACNTSILIALFWSQYFFRFEILGNTSCLDCGNSEEMRQFFVVPVRGTNLVLVVVEYFSEKAIFHYTKRTDNIPGKQQESILFH